MVLLLLRWRMPERSAAGLTCSVGTWACDVLWVLGITQAKRCASRWAYIVHHNGHSFDCQHENVVVQALRVPARQPARQLTMYGYVRASAGSLHQMNAVNASCLGPIQLGLQDTATDGRHPCKAHALAHQGHPPSHCGTGPAHSQRGIHDVALFCPVARSEVSNSEEAPKLAGGGAQ